MRRHQKPPKALPPARKVGKRFARHVYLTDRLYQATQKAAEASPYRTWSAYAEAAIREKLERSES